MCRLRFIEPEDASDSTKEAFKKLVLVPNLLCIMANSDVVIEAFANHNANLDKYKLSTRHRKAITLAVSQFNDCNYCIALHTSNAIDSGILTSEECLDARRMKSPEPKMNALLELTKEILENRGRVGDEIIEKVKRHGFDDQDIVEAIATISLIIQANYTANVARPEIDFVEAPPLEEKT